MKIELHTLDLDKKNIEPKLRKIGDYADYIDFEKAVMFDKRSLCTIFCIRIKMFSTVCMICDKKLQRIKYITMSTFLFYNIVY